MWISPNFKKCDRITGKDSMEVVKNKMNKSKIVPVFLIIAFFISGLAIPFTHQKAKAAFPYDAEVSDVLTRIWDEIRPVIIITIKKKAISIAQNRVLDFIRGQDGAPLFIKNWEKWLFEDAQSAAFAAVDKYLGVDLCQTINVNIKTAVVRQLDLNEGFDDSLECTLDALVADPKNWNVLKDGWEPYFASLDDNQSIYGIYSNALSKGLTAISRKEFENAIKGISGNGYVNEDKKGNVIQPGSRLSSFVNNLDILPFQLDINSEDFGSIVSSVASGIINNFIKGL